MPPVDAFWSITMYDDKGFPVQNKINRQAIGDRDKLTVDKDGSSTCTSSTSHPGPKRNRIGYLRQKEPSRWQCVAIRRDLRSLPASGCRQS